MARSIEHFDETERAVGRDTWCRPLTIITGALVHPFVLLDRHVPAVRRHGYLLATVVTKPG